MKHISILSLLWIVTIMAQVAQGFELGDKVRLIAPQYDSMQCEGTEATIIGIYSNAAILYQLTNLKCEGQVLKVYAGEGDIELVSKRVEPAVMYNEAE